LDTVNTENAVASGQVLRRRTTRRYRVSGTDCVQGVVSELYRRERERWEERTTFWKWHPQIKQKLR